LSHAKLNTIFAPRRYVFFPCQARIRRLDIGLGLPKPALDTASYHLVVFFYPTVNVESYFVFGSGGSIRILHRKANYHMKSDQSTSNKPFLRLTMTLRKTKENCAIAILLAALLTGCQSHSDYHLLSTGNGITPTSYALRPAPLVVFFFRESSYKGLGRIHELKIDDKPIGRLTADSYFRIELWPGDYQFSVHLPSEDFFGSHSPPENTTMRLSFGESASSGIFVYRYVDGEGIYHVEPVDDAVIARIEHTRVLSAHLSARDTAQVKFLHDARYDGPASFGKAHGYGALKWDDGSVLQGRFEYGETTEEGEFFTTDGKMYMGLKSKGRPIGPGVWMTLDRQILYAGAFQDELPHGTGTRSGIEGPEFCVYENGEDITKTIKQLAQEAVDEEDKRTKEEETVDAESNDASEVDEIPVDSNQGDNASPNAEKSSVPPVGNQPMTAASIPDKNLTATTAEANDLPDATKYKPTRNERVLAKVKIIKRRIEKKLEEKRLWCQEEFALGRQLCECAPFAAEFKKWSGCVDK
jgi:hypothetical protein